MHDIGHPPFGHAGEIALDAVMRRHGARFDHNLHALRIVESFEKRYIDFTGLNLTFEVREGIIKHSRDYAADEHPELAEYLLDLRPPLEAQLIDLADEIAYNTADLDDGFEARLLGIDEILERVRIFERFYREVDKRHPQASTKLKFNEALKRMLDRFVTGLIETTAERVRQARNPHPRRRSELAGEARGFQSGSRLRAARSQKSSSTKSSTTAPRSSRRKPMRSRS